MRYNELITESAEPFNWAAIYNAIKGYVSKHIGVAPEKQGRLQDMMQNTDTFWTDTLDDIPYALRQIGDVAYEAKNVYNDLLTSVSYSIEQMSYNVVEYFGMDENLPDAIQNVSQESIEAILNAGAPALMAQLKAELKPVAAAPAKKVATGEKFTDANVTQAVADFKKMLPNFSNDLMTWFQEERVPHKTRKGGMSVPQFTLSKRNGISLNQADMESVNTPEEALQLVSSKLDDKDFVLFVIDNCRLDIDNRHNFWGLEKSSYWKKKLYNALAPVILTIKK